MSTAFIFIAYILFIGICGFYCVGRLITDWPLSGSTRAIFGFTATLLLLAIVGTGATILNAPAKMTSLVYLAAVSTVTFTTYKFRINSPPPTVRCWKLSEIIFWSVCALDLIVASIALTPLQADGLVHLARIQNLIEFGFSLQDPFFPNAIESRYHFNVLHWFNAFVACWSPEDAAAVFLFSSVFFRGLFWGALFFVFKDAMKLAAPAFPAAIALLIFANNEFLFNYPKNAVVIWWLLFAGMISLKGRQQTLWLCAFALLCGLTHPLAALLCAAVYAVYQGLIWPLSRKQPIAKHGAVIASFLWAPFFSSIQKNYMPQKIFKYKVPELEIFTPNLYAAPLPDLAPLGILFVVLAFCISGRRKRLLPLVLMWVATIAVAYFLLHSPFIFPLVSKILPYWALKRISSLNVFTTIFTAYASYHLLLFVLAKHPGLIRIRPYKLAIPLLILAAVFINPSPVKGLRARASNEQDFLRLKEIEFLTKKHLKPGDSILADLYTNLAIPAVFPGLSIIAIPPGQATPNANIQERLHDQQALWSGSSSQFQIFSKKYRLRYVLTGAASEEAIIKKYPVTLLETVGSHSLFQVVSTYD